MATKPATKPVAAATSKAAAKTTAPTKAPPKLSTSREVANWDEELAKQAEAAAETEASTATGQMFSVKAGVLSWNDAPLQNNEVACIVVDAILENTYYTDRFDADNPAPPTCFAFGRLAESMAPHETVVARGQQQHDTCTGCPHDKFGSADTGRGKACGNKRRLALIPAGTFDKNGKFEAEDDAGVLEKAELGFIKLPVTSVKGWAAYVKQLAANKKPPWGVFTRLKVVPDTKTQFKVTFEALGFVPNKLMGVVMAKHQEAVSTIEQPYNLDFEAETPAPRRAAGKPLVKGKRKF